MKNSIRNILILICVVILFIVVLFLLLHFEIIKVGNNRNIDTTAYSDEDDITMVSSEIGYRELGGSFMIYNKNGDYITTVRSYDEIEYYVKNPDANPTGGIYQEASQDDIEKEYLEE